MDPFAVDDGAVGKNLEEDAELVAVVRADERDARDQRVGLGHGPADAGLRDDPAGLRRAGRGDGRGRPDVRDRPPCSSGEQRRGMRRRVITGEVQPDAAADVVEPPPNRKKRPSSPGSSP